MPKRKSLRQIAIDTAKNWESLWEHGPATEDIEAPIHAELKEAIIKRVCEAAVYRAGSSVSAVADKLLLDMIRSDQIVFDCPKESLYSKAIQGLKAAKEEVAPADIGDSVLMLQEKVWRMVENGADSDDVAFHLAITKKRAVSLIESSKRKAKAAAREYERFFPDARKK